MVKYLSVLYLFLGKATTAKLWDYNQIMFAQIITHYYSEKFLEKQLCDPNRKEL